MSIPRREADVTVNEILTAANMKRIWKEEVRTKLRASTLADLHFAQDPFHWLSIEINLDGFLQSIVDTLSSGRYTAEVCSIVRAAKSKGLVRPLAYLSPRDAVVYRTLIAHAEPRLLQSDRPWTGFRRSEKASSKPKTPESEPVDSFDWFTLWLKNQGQSVEMAERSPFLVETDISNFFASIDLDVVREHLLAHSGLPKDAVRLCMYLIQQVSPRPRHATFPAQGLPQENQDSSRAIAHSLLNDLDSALEEYGKKDNFVRFMDDMLVGVQTVDEGERVVRRIQLKLEEIGLHPNSAKTRIVPSEEYLAGLCPDDNGFLDRVNHEFDRLRAGDLRHVTNPPRELVEELETRASAFRLLPPQGRAARWDRVLRRYYTALRNARSQVFLGDDVIADARALPSATRTLLEYVRAYPLSIPMANQLFDLAINWRDLYEDLSLACLEVILTAPNVESSGVGKLIGPRALDLIQTFRAGEHVREEFADLAVATLTVLVGKYGGSAELSAMDTHWRAMKPGTNSWMQALVVLAAGGVVGEVELNGPPPSMGWAASQNWAILRSLLQGDSKTVGFALGILTPTPRLQPLRHYVHPRGIVLLPLLQRSGDRRVKSIARTISTRLGENPEGLRDERGIQLADKLLTNGSPGQLSTPSASL